jgi:hypothetical protein
MAEFDPLVRPPGDTAINWGAGQLQKFLTDLPTTYRQAALDQAKVDAVNKLRNLSLVDPNTGQAKPNVYGAMAQILAATDPRSAVDLLKLGQEQQDIAQAQDVTGRYFGGGQPGAAGAAYGPSGGGADPRGLVPYIRETAVKYGINPDVAVRVAGSEGLSDPVGDRGASFGAFQLFTGGGLGNDFQRDTGLDPRDPRNEKATIDYALRRASQQGWGAWYGAPKVGVGQWTGIGRPTGPPQGNTVADMVGNVWKGESDVSRIVTNNIARALNVSPDDPLPANKKEIAQRYVENYARRRDAAEPERRPDSVPTRTAEDVPLPRPRPDIFPSEQLPMPTRPDLAYGGPPAAAPAAVPDLGFTAPLSTAPLIAGARGGAMPGMPFGAAPVAAAPAAAPSFAERFTPPSAAPEVAADMQAARAELAQQMQQAYGVPPVAPPPVAPPPGGAPPPPAPPPAAEAPELVRPRRLPPGYSRWQDAVDDMRRDGNRLAMSRSPQVQRQAQRLLAEADAIEKSHGPMQISANQPIFNPETRQWIMPPMVPGGRGSGGVQGMILQKYIAEHPEATAEELQAFNISGRSAGRSAIAQYMARWSAEHPKASADAFKLAQQQYQRQLTAQNRFFSGPAGNTIRSLDVVVSHIGVLDDMTKALQNGQLQFFNRLAQNWAEASGKPEPTNFKVAAQVVGTEIMKALTNAGVGSAAERQELSNAFNVAESPEQLRGSMATVRRLLGGQLNGLRRQFKESTGLKDEDFNQLLSPENLQWYQGKDGTSQAPNYSTMITVTPRQGYYGEPQSGGVPAGGVIRYDAQGRRLGQ